MTVERMAKAMIGMKRQLEIQKVFTAWKERALFKSANHKMRALRDQAGEHVNLLQSELTHHREENAELLVEVAYSTHVERLQRWARLVIALQQKHILDKGKEQVFSGVAMANLQRAHANHQLESKKQTLALERHIDALKKIIKITSQINFFF